MKAWPCLVAAAAACGIVATPVRAQGAWEQLGGGPHGDGSRAIAASVTRLESPVWVSDAIGLSTSASIVLLPGTPDQLIAWGVSGGDVVLHSLSAEDGSLLWTSEPFAPGVTVSFESWSSPCADSVLRQVYFGVGDSLVCLDGDTGDTVWTTPLIAGGSSDLVNGSPHVAEGMVCITTYGGFAPVGKRLYAIDAVDGSIEWSVQDGGPGSEAPVIVTSFLPHRVVSLKDNGMAAYNLDTGAVLWTSAAPLAGSPWSSTFDFLGGLSQRDLSLFAPTTNFAGQGELISVNLQTGQLHFNQPNVVSGSSTPAILSGRVFVAGQEFFGGPSYLTAHDFGTGNELWRRELSPDSTMWNLSAVAVNDAVYVTEGDPGFSMAAVQGLRILDPATGEDLATPTVTSELARGTPILGTAGEVFVLWSGGRMAAWRAPLLEPDGVLPLLADLNGSVGAGFTDHPTVRVQFQHTEGAEFRIAQDAPISGATWNALPMGSLTFLLTGGPGEKNVVLQLRNGSGESTTLSGTINYLGLGVTGWDAY